MEVGKKVWFAFTDELTVREGVISQIGHEGLGDDFPVEIMPYYVEFDGYQSMFVLKQHLFDTKEEAIECVNAVKKEHKDELLKDNKWIIDMFETYMESFGDVNNFEEIILKEIIKEKLGIEIE